MLPVLVAGSIAFDMLLTYDGSFADGIDTENLDELSVGYVTRHLERHHGGTGANIAWNFALLKQEVMVTGSVGADGGDYLERLKQKNINISLVREQSEEVTSTAIIGTDSSERQITFYHPGADTQTQSPDLAALKDSVSYAIISPHSTSSMLQIALACQKHGVPYMFDPGQQSLQFSKDDLLRIVKGSNALIANAYEWSLLRDALGWSMNDTLSYTGILIVTQGEHGLNIQTAEESIQVEAVPAEKLVNPTGAGDALRAGFITGLQRGWNVRDAGRLGAAIASFAVESDGPQMESFDIHVMQERAEKVYGEALPTL